MARYVLVEFDDNNEAERFQRALDVGDIGERVSLDEWADFLPSGVRVRAVWFKPTVFCECSDVDDKSTRGQKWGMYVHIKCGKPKRGMCQHPRNLLDPPEMPLMMRTEYLGIYEPAVRGGIAWEASGRTMDWRSNLATAKALGTR